LGEFGGALAGFEDLLHLRAQRIDVGELAVDDLAVSVDYGEKIVEIVSHAAGEPSDALELLGLHVTLLRLAKFRFRLPGSIAFAYQPDRLPASQPKQKSE
jgi:hypothetical protein